MKKLLYFGCIKECGHYLWVSERENVCNCSALKRYSGIDGVTDRFLNGIDGTYVPGTTQEQGVYQESIVPPFRIVAWHDYTVDRRPGSNSAILGIGYDSAVEMLADAVEYFPLVMKRQSPPRPIVAKYSKGSNQ